MGLFRNRNKSGKLLKGKDARSDGLDTAGVDKMETRFEESNVNYGLGVMLTFVLSVMMVG